MILRDLPTIKRIARDSNLGLEPDRLKQCLYKTRYYHEAWEAFVLLHDDEIIGGLVCHYPSIAEFIAESSRISVSYKPYELLLKQVTDSRKSPGGAVTIVVKAENTPVQDFFRKNRVLRFKATAFIRKKSLLVMQDIKSVEVGQRVSAEECIRRCST